MRVIGIIVEYNPLQNGHEYQLQIARKIYNADFVVVVMTGNYNQRGIPAMIPKTIRAQHAINVGADIVIELPVCYSISDLPLFSHAAITLLNSLGIVDNILFGSETGRIDNIIDMATIMKSSEYHKFYTGSEQKRNYDKRVEALRKMGYTAYADCVNQPNNLLGINYVQALEKVGSNIIPLTNRRIGQAYMDTNILINFGEKVYASATAIRKCLQNALCTSVRIPQYLQKCMPECVFEWMENNWKFSFPVLFMDFWELIKETIQAMSIDELIEIEGMDEAIATYIKEKIAHNISYDMFRNEFERDMVNVNLNRRLFRILTKQKKRDMCGYIASGVIFYARILAVSNNAEWVVNEMKMKASIPVMRDLEVCDDMLSTIANKQLMNDFESDYIYNLVYEGKYGTEKERQ